MALVTWDPVEPTSEGARLLREALRARSSGQVARKLGCTGAAVRRWARGVVVPQPEYRERLRVELGIALESWEQAAGSVRSGSMESGPVRSGSE